MAIIEQGITLDQRQSALKRANEVRLTNAAFRRRVVNMDAVAGLLTVAMALENPTAEQAALKVEDLLRMPRWMGAVVINKLLITAGVRRAGRRVRDLSARQREVLAGGLRARAERRIREGKS